MIFDFILAYCVKKSPDCLQQEPVLCNKLDCVIQLSEGNKQNFLIIIAINIG